mmetsp:Transcript_17368/g.33774  ORF Transcript_17368/g.33774 Transcript_17368/m.33774 type:complete len:209 (+) Transcript_17368:2794-3420(+)
MPSGSKFSILQTVIQLPLMSRTTSYSTSFQPRSDLSMITCEEHEKALFTSSRSDFSSSAKPEPSPPSAKAARTSTGNPSFFPAATASSRFVAMRLGATCSPISFNFIANASRSSVASITGIWVPRTIQLCLSRIPDSLSWIPQLRAVWPPNCNRMPSGFSFSMTFSTFSGRIGRKYVRSAMPADVCTVAMLGLIKTTSMFSSFKALMA